MATLHGNGYILKVWSKSLGMTHLESYGAKVPCLGEPVTCDGPCQHSDCATTRELVSNPPHCEVCGDKLKSGELFFRTDEDGWEHASHYDG